MTLLATRIVVLILARSVVLGVIRCALVLTGQGVQVGHSVEASHYFNNKMCSRSHVINAMLCGARYSFVPQFMGVAASILPCANVAADIRRAAFDVSVSPCRHLPALAPAP